ncbi:MAG: hypothetical protein GY952_14085 [Rhodobacteraceae bacterium]|nr:hypothetical protein [Paracoccaceae bacterium]
MGTFRARGGLAGGKSDSRQGSMPAIVGNTARTWRKTTSGASQTLDITNPATASDDAAYLCDCDSDIYFAVEQSSTVTATDSDVSIELLSTDLPIWVILRPGEDIAVIDKS